MCRLRIYRWMIGLLLLGLLASCSSEPNQSTSPPDPSPSPTSEEMTIVVTNASDSGPGSLRQALIDAGEGYTITFDQEVFPPDNPVTIYILNEELPHIRVNNLTLDASNAGVVLDGSQTADQTAHGFQIVDADGVQIMGFQITNFPQPGIKISGRSSNNTIGGDPSVGAGPYGQGNFLNKNVYGIALEGEGVTQNMVAGNLLCTDQNGIVGWEGLIGEYDGAHDNVIQIDNIVLEVEADPETAADIIFFNGNVITMDADLTVAEALAVKGQTIMAVGTSEEILAYQGSGTQMIDLNGHTLLPGFIDGHTHVLAFSSRMDRSLDEAQEVAIKHGFTTVNEMWADEGYLGRLQQAELEGSLRLRVNVFASYNAGTLDDNHQKVILQTWYPENPPLLDPESHLRIPGIKIFMDGDNWSAARGCWAMSEPFVPGSWIATSGICGTPAGDLYWDQEEINQVVADAQAAGYRVAFHAMGDLAIETALNAIEYAIDGESNTLYRHQIEHNSMARDDLLPRYASMGVPASVRGYAELCLPEDGMPVMGMDRSPWYVNRYVLANMDIHPYVETDFGWTVDPEIRNDQRTLDPIMHIFGLVNHLAVYDDGSICAPASWAETPPISVETALQMLTINPAYAVSMEEYTGSLEEGKFADLIILSGDPLTVDPSSLLDLRVWMTMIDGQVEYCADGADSFCPMQ